MAYSEPNFHSLPWAAPDVFRTLLEHIDGPRILDPGAVRAILQEERGLPERPVRIAAAYSSATFQCAAGGSTPLGRFLQPLCSGADALHVESYGESAAPEPHADTRRLGLSEAELAALEFRLGEFLRTAEQRGLRVVHLNRDREWSAAMAGHFPWPLNARLVIPRDRPQMLLIQSFPALPDDAAGDRVHSITVYSRR